MEDQGHLLWLGVKNVCIYFSFQFFSKVLVSESDLRTTTLGETWEKESWMTGRRKDEK